MVKPVNDNDNKSYNKNAPELSSNAVMLLSNGIMIIVVIVAMIVMYLALDSSFNKKIAKLLPDSEQSQEEGDEEQQEGVLLDLGDFILNLADPAHRRYLKVGIAMELSKTQEEIILEQTISPKTGSHGHVDLTPNVSSALIQEMERYKPAIRDAVISVLSNKTSDELSTPTGKEIAKEEITEMVNNIFEGQREVMRISFGQFIIQ